MTSPVETSIPTSPDQISPFSDSGKPVGGEGWKQSAQKRKQPTGLAASKDRGGRVVEPLAPELQEQYQDTGIVLGKGTYGSVRLLKDKKSDSDA